MSEIKKIGIVNESGDVVSELEFTLGNVKALSSAYTEDSNERHFEGFAVYNPDVAQKAGGSKMVTGFTSEFTLNEKGNASISAPKHINLEPGMGVQVKPGTGIIIDTKNHILREKIANGAVWDNKKGYGDYNELEIEAKYDDYKNDAESYSMREDGCLTSSEYQHAYMKLKARAFDVRCLEHGGIALQPCGQDNSNGVNHENKIKFESSRLQGIDGEINTMKPLYSTKGGNGLEFATFNNKHTSIFTGDYRFKGDAMVFGVTRGALQAGDALCGTTVESKVDYPTQGDDFKDVLPGSAVTLSNGEYVGATGATWNEIVQVARDYSDGKIGVTDGTGVVAELRAEIAALRAELDEIKANGVPASSGTTDEPEVEPFNPYELLGTLVDSATVFDYKITVEKYSGDTSAEGDVHEGYIEWTNTLDEKLATCGSNVENKLTTEERTGYEYIYVGSSPNNEVMTHGYSTDTSVLTEEELAVKYNYNSGDFIEDLEDGTEDGDFCRHYTKQYVTLDYDFYATSEDGSRVKVKPTVGFAIEGQYVSANTVSELSLVPNMDRNRIVANSASTDYLNANLGDIELFRLNDGKTHSLELSDGVDAVVFTGIANKSKNNAVIYVDTNEADWTVGGEPLTSGAMVFGASIATSAVYEARPKSGVTALTLTVPADETKLTEFNVEKSKKPVINVKFYKLNEEPAEQA